MAVFEQNEVVRSRDRGFNGVAADQISNAAVLCKLHPGACFALALLWGCFQSSACCGPGPGVVEPTLRS